MGRIFFWRVRPPCKMCHWRHYEGLSRSSTREGHPTFLLALIIPSSINQIRYDFSAAPATVDATICFLVVALDPSMYSISFELRGYERSWACHRKTEFSQSNRDSMYEDNAIVIEAVASDIGGERGRRMCGRESEIFLNYGTLLTCHKAGSFWDSYRERWEWLTW